jgi:Zn-finger protein
MMILVAVVATLALAGCSREITTVTQELPSASSCFDCHSDEDTYLVAANFAWSNSWHASGRVVARSSSGGCAGCHSTEGLIAVAAGESPVGVDDPTVIHCFGCHAPHSNGDFRLRITEPVPLQDGASFDIGSGNLCSQCHQSRRDVNSYVSGEVKLSEHWGPHHGPQSDMLFGSNGYEYDGYDYGDMIYHRTMTDDGCVDCHFKYSNTYAVGGHSFNMRFEDAEGEEILNAKACRLCHGVLKDYDVNMVQTEVDSMMTVLHDLLETAGMVDDGGHPIEDFVASADSAGALWNFLIVEEDRSMGVHNSDYAKSLLDSGIKFLNGELPQGK